MVNIILVISSAGVLNLMMINILVIVIINLSDQEKSTEEQWSWFPVNPCEIESADVRPGIQLLLLSSHWKPPRSVPGQSHNFYPIVNYYRISPILFIVHAAWLKREPCGICFAVGQSRRMANIGEDSLLESPAVERGLLQSPLQVKGSWECYGSAIIDALRMANRWGA